MHYSIGQASFFGALLFPAKTERRIIPLSLSMMTLHCYPIFFLKKKKNNCFFEKRVYFCTPFSAKRNVAKGKEIFSSYLDR